MNSLTVAILNTVVPEVYFIFIYLRVALSCKNRWQYVIGYTRCLTPVDLDPRGSKSTSKYGPPLADLDLPSKVKYIGNVNTII